MTVTYIDTSAIGKLLVEEIHSAALTTYVNSLGEGDLVASALLETELRRMAFRHSLPQADVTGVLTGVSLVLPERDFFRRAGLLPDANLRSLDALHLVTAMDAEAEVLVSYDHRMIEAAEMVGVPTVSPQ